MSSWNISLLGGLKMNKVYFVHAINEWKIMSHDHDKSQLGND